MAAASDLRLILEKGDYRALRRFHSELLPHVPAPQSDQDAEVSLHMARTQAEWLSERARCYSHAWLVERGMPSQLPDSLKPQAERLYPRIAEAVFVSVNSNSPLIKPIVPLVQQAMCDAVEDCFANGDRDPALVRGRMQEAREKTFRSLVGTAGAR